MKQIKYISIIILLFSLLVSCSDDIVETKYNPENAKTGELLPIKSKYILSIDNADNELEVFTWDKMDLGYPAAIKYSLEIDLQDKNFENPQIVTTVNKTSATIKTEALNKAMLGLQKVYQFMHETPQNVEFRIKGSISDVAAPVYTNAVSSNVTPYFEYNKLWIIGSYCDWGHDKSQYLYQYDEDNSNIFEAWIDFGVKASEGFKITDAANWSKGNWGSAPGVSIENEAKTIKFAQDGGNINAYSKRFYKFSFNTSTLTLYNIASINSLGITGNAVGNTDIEMDFSSKNQVFIASLKLNDGQIKFRADNKNELVYGKDSEDGRLKENGDAISVKAGTYLIKVNLNNSRALNYSIEAIDALDLN